MEKLKMMSMDKTQMNIQKIKEQFPNAVTEVLRNGKTALAVDFDVLKQELSDALIDEREERYQFTWPDKRKSVLLANSPISATLRPCREESVNFDTTQNLYIEGDNLDVLKLLQETYLGKIKMIYIDPPYNTGNDFVYKDDFSQSAEEYAETSGQFDEQGNRLFQNTESNGRFHTDWLNMMYPRLKVAKDLLSDDGVIFISIDDNEQANLKKMCDEVFGEKNYLNTFCWLNNLKGRQISNSGAVKTYENVLCYTKNIDLSILFEADSTLLKEKMPSAYKGFNYDIRYDDSGAYVIKNELYNTNSAFNEQTRPNLVFCIHYNQATRDIKFSDVTDNVAYSNYVKIMPKKNNDGMHKFHAWRWSKEKILNEKFNLEFIENGNTYKIFTKIRDFEKTSVKDIITDINNGNLELEQLFKGIKLFAFPKASTYIKLFLQCIYEKNIIVLDFFSGSATTAHAVMQLNAEDGGNRKFIMVQLPEKCGEKSEAYKAGYKNICEIGKERIRRAGKKIQENIKFNKPLEDYITEDERKSGKATIAKTASNGTSGLIDEIESGTETFIDLVTKEKTTKEYSKNNPKDHYRFYPDDLDIGFRVLKLDSSNMKDVYYRPEQYRQSLLEDLGDNIKEDRTPLDLLFQVMLELGKPLSAKIEEKDICGKHVFIVDENDLIACFDADVTAETVKAIALLKPLYAVFRDSSLADDAVGSNFDQIFATYSPNTTRRVL